MTNLTKGEVAIAMLDDSRALSAGFFSNRIDRSTFHTHMDIIHRYIGMLEKMEPGAELTEEMLLDYKPVADAVVEQRNYATRLLVKHMAEQLGLNVEDDIPDVLGGLGKAGGQLH